MLKPLPKKLPYPYILMAKLVLCEELTLMFKPPMKEFCRKEQGSLLI
jgi:hypothetical protein